MTDRETKQGTRDMSTPVTEFAAHTVHAAGKRYDDLCTMCHRYGTNPVRWDDRDDIPVNEAEV